MRGRGRRAQFWLARSVSFQTDEINITSGSCQTDLVYGLKPLRFAIPASKRSREFGQSCMSALIVP